MNKIDPLKKKYFYLHLYSSLVAIISISIICQYFWFPEPFLQLDATWFAILTLSCIDIIIGPCLTLLLVHSKKSKLELRIDLVVILAIQLSALSYGLAKIYQERVFAIVYENGIFHPIPAKEIPKALLDNNFNLPKYNNVYYAMIGDISSTHKIEIKPLLYSPTKYQPLKKIILEDKNIEYQSLPYHVRSKYSETYTFKILVGKSHSAFVVLSDEFTILEIIIGNKLSDIN
jgi:hypothetical protein